MANTVSENGSCIFTPSHGPSTDEGGIPMGSAAPVLRDRTRAPWNTCILPLGTGGSHPIHMRQVMTEPIPWTPFPRNIHIRAQGTSEAPALAVEQADKSHGLNLRYGGYEIKQRECSLPGLPSMYGEGRRTQRALRYT